MSYISERLITNKNQTDSEQNRYTSYNEEPECLDDE